jgi:hypothetical protein
VWYRIDRKTKILDPDAKQKGLVLPVLAEVMSSDVSGASWNAVLNCRAEALQIEV